MNKFPKVEFSKNSLAKNITHLLKVCNSKNVTLCSVTKLTRGNPDIAQLLCDNGAEEFGESRLAHIKNLRKGGIETRIGHIQPVRYSEAEEIVQYTDWSWNTSFQTLEALSNEALKQNKIHDVITGIEVGDLRDGFLWDEFIEVFPKIMNLKGINIWGLGANVGCLSGVLPTPENLGKIVELKRILRDKFNIEIPVLSVGGTCCYKLVESGEIPDGINHIRIGEGIFCGNDPTNERTIPGTVSNTANVYAEIIEIRKKTSKPGEPRGRDAFGLVPKIEDKGDRIRGLVSLGLVEVPLSSIEPVDPGLTVLGINSEMIALDFTDSERDYKLGEYVGFKVKDYAGLMHLLSHPEMNVGLK